MKKKKAEIEARENASPPKAQFTANPIPRACSVLIYDKKIKEEELKRAERIRK